MKYTVIFSSDAFRKPTGDWWRKVFHRQDALLESDIISGVGHEIYKG